MFCIYGCQVFNFLFLFFFLELDDNNLVDLDLVFAPKEEESPPIIIMGIPLSQNSLCPIDSDTFISYQTSCFGDKQVVLWFPPCWWQGVNLLEYMQGFDMDEDEDKDNACHLHHPHNCPPQCNVQYNDCNSTNTMATILTWRTTITRTISNPSSHMKMPATAMRLTKTVALESQPKNAPNWPRH